MASISTLQASSSTPNPHSYDVFLSFRGEDTARILLIIFITLWLHMAFTPSEMMKNLRKERASNRVCLELSKDRRFYNYFLRKLCYLKWCLNELVNIIEHTALENNKVIPVFYHVKPSDVGHQSGSFEDAFFNHEKDADQEKKELIEKWRIALKKAATLTGYHAEVIQKIREVIITRLNRKPLYVGDNVVGMEPHLKQLKSLIKTKLDDVHMVGIYGIGGIGKTTIAMAFYNDVSSRFDGSSFLRGVGEKSKGGLLELQKKLLEDILKCQSPKFRKTCMKRVLIVLDDVDELEQLENLAGKIGWYGAKSTIIITTKDTSLLSQHGVNQFYEVKELNREEAIELFNWWAFKQNIPKPKEDFASLSHRVVEYAKGLPLALKVLGGFLLKNTHMKVQNVLKVSYDRLDDIEKEIFLDIACFFKGEDKDFVSRILGRYAEIGIKVLHERCLITISENKLDMHDLLQQMGREIVRQECLKEPGKRSRLWDSNDVDSVLTRNTIPSFYGFSLESLPTNFKGRNLVELDLIYSSIKQLWKGNEILDNLKVINLSYSQDLVEIPNFSSVPNLEILNLEGCINLLKSLPRSISNLSSLQTLYLHNCSKLKGFPEMKDNMENLERHDLSGTAIDKLSSSIGHLKALKHLYLSYGTAIKELPASIERLGGLQDLHLSNCSNLVNLPESISIQSDDYHISSWEALNRSINHFSSIIPISIIQLSKLRVLDLSHCQKLLQIPELPPSLRILDVHACPYLETLSSPSSLLGFSLFKCFKSAIEEFECGSYWSKGIQIVIPGNNGIPKWIKLPLDWYQNNDFLGFALYSVYVPLHIESKEVSCSLKCKLNFHGHRYEFLDDLPSTFRSMDGLSSKFWPIGGLSFRSSRSCHHNGDELNGVWVAYYPKVAIPNQYKSNKWRHLKASFRGYLGGKQVKVKEGGFHLIYMPEIVNEPSHNIPIKGIKRDRTSILIQTGCSKMLWHQIEEKILMLMDELGRHTYYDHDHSSMDTITRNIDDNVVDAQDDEEDHIPKWLYLLCKSIQRISVEDTKRSSLALLVSFCYVILSAQILSKDLFIFLFFYSLIFF
ncbi:hypothetical protein AAG906_024516 [Vitis piasezkii]